MCAILNDASVAALASFVGWVNKHCCFLTVLLLWHNLFSTGVLFIMILLVIDGHLAHVLIPSDSCYNKTQQEHFYLLSTMINNSERMVIKVSNQSLMRL